MVYLCLLINQIIFIIPARALLSPCLVLCTKTLSIFVIGINQHIINVNPDLIIHLAAQALVLEGYTDPVGTWETNLMGTVNLLSTCQQLEGKYACLIITTDKVYKNREWSFGYRENDQIYGTDHTVLVNLPLKLL